MVLPVELFSLIVSTAFRVNVKRLLQTLIRLVVSLQNTLKFLFLHLLLVLDWLEHANATIVLGSPQIEQKAISSVTAYPMPILSQITSLLAIAANRIRDDQIQGKFGGFHVFRRVFVANDAKTSLIHRFFVHFSCCDLRYSAG